MTTNLIRITSDVEIPRLTYTGQPVLTFALIDVLHSRPEGTASAAFRRNRNRFIDGEDFYVLDYKSLDVWCREFITVVLRPLVSMRKVRAMAKRQWRQPILVY